MRRLLIPSVAATALMSVTLAAQTAPPAAPAADAPAASTPTGYTYDPGDRRDPFVSLLRRGSDAPVPRGAAGLASLGVAEVDLRGTLESRGGFLGILEGVDTRTYIVRPGDRLLDGTIQSINANTLVILQRVEDPLAAEKERSVRKTLRQMEGARP